MVAVAFGINDLARPPCRRLYRRANRKEGGWELENFVLEKPPAAAESVETFPANGKANWCKW
ncbi:hypothetical protein Pla52o_04140 [Novipirellula galeiformis]|uniref:Uncharacterized protein n=1 Tax=Novipirellula galeiformis TaxID=2528004 RepID=A0A5C6CT09_9BACT|nr:hypothetical protein Pla52o_04140 [Novipirellula galeiformis]